MICRLVSGLRRLRSHNVSQDYHVLPFSVDSRFDGTVD